MTINNEKKRILFVCSGNTCRSPMAKVILEQKLEDRGQLDRFVVDSAAFNDTDYPEASRNTREAIKKIYGQDLLATHKSKNLTSQLTGKADLILAMTGAIKNMLPLEKSWTLKEYAGSSGIYGTPSVIVLKTTLNVLMKYQNSWAV